MRAQAAFMHRSDAELDREGEKQDMPGSTSSGECRLKAEAPVALGPAYLGNRRLPFEWDKCDCKHRNAEDPTLRRADSKSTAREDEILGCPDPEHRVVGAE